MDLSRILGELIMVPWTEGEAAERERDGQIQVYFGGTVHETC